MIVAQACIQDAALQLKGKFQDLLHLFSAVFQLLLELRHKPVAVLEGDLDVRVRRYIHKIFRTPRRGILEKHRHAIELDAIYQDSGIAQVVAVLVQPLQSRAPKAEVVVAGYEDLVPVRQTAEPFHKVQRLPLGPHHREVPRMHDHIALRQPSQQPVHVVSV